MIKTNEITMLAYSKGMNIRQLANKAGIPYNTLYAAIQRNSKISADNMEKIEKALEHPMTEYETKDSEYDKSLLTPDEKNLIKLCRNIAKNVKPSEVGYLYDVISNVLICNKKIIIQLVKEDK